MQNQNTINRQLGLSVSLLGKNTFACLFLCISLFFSIEHCNISYSNIKSILYCHIIIKSPQFYRFFPAVPVERVDGELGVENVKFTRSQRQDGIPPSRTMTSHVALAVHVAILTSLFVRSLRHFGIAENLRPGDENLRHLTVTSRFKKKSVYFWQSKVITQPSFMRASS